MSSWESCKTNGALFCPIVVLAILIFLFFARQVQAAGIDSIRAMPTATPIEMPADPRESAFNGEQLLSARDFPVQQIRLPETVASADEACLTDGGTDAVRLANYYNDCYSPSGLNMAPAAGVEPWTWQVLPRGLIFRSFLASGREPRFAVQFVKLRDQEWVWDATVGARVGLLRYGTQNPLAPRGWELDLEGAAFPRLTLDSQRDMIASDFRVGIPLTYRRDNLQWKLAVYHLSSHLADEYILIHPERERINYSRDVLTLAAGYFPREDVRLYAECGWAWYADGGSRPWEFQFGVEYSPLYPNGIKGTPFFAINTRLRQEVDYGGNMTVQAGWQWRGYSGQRFRLGLQYFNGMSDQYQFFREFEEQIGFGIWYDF